jgi:hypothetical protein
MTFPVALMVDVPSAGRVSALLLNPPSARLLYVLAHGAGAGMRHPFLEGIAEALAAHDVATFRYQFPYMEAKRRSPDRPDVAQATVRAAVEAAREAAPDLPLIAGGKSFGGRMTSQAAAAASLSGVRGIAFLGFPLHPPKRPGTARSEHLDRVSVPMLFLQGSRDDLADRTLMQEVTQRLGSRATLHVVEGADHSFKLPKAAGRSGPAAWDELAGVIARWGGGLVSS